MNLVPGLGIEPRTRGFSKLVPVGALIIHITHNILRRSMEFIVASTLHGANRLRAFEPPREIA